MTGIITSLSELDDLKAKAITKIELDKMKD